MPSRRRSTVEPDPAESPFVEGTDDEPPIGDDLPPTEETTPNFGTFNDEEQAEKVPKSTGPRAPVVDLLTMAWGGVGTLLIRTGTDIPVGRVLQFQAPLAGKQIDDLIAHTWLDAILQPLAKQVDRLEGLGAIIALPIMVGAYERNAEIGAATEPLMRELIHATLLDMAPVVRKKQADARKAARSLDPELFGLEKGTDPVDAVLAQIFASDPRMETAAETNGNVS